MGIVPEGLWVLNVARSRKLKPAEHLLWIVRDDGRQLSWVSIERSADQALTITSWQGEYNGPPVEVTGMGAIARVTSGDAGEMTSSGSMPGLGEFVERAQVLDDGKRLLCHGEVTSADGVLTYVEDFDWVGAVPF